MPSYTPPFGAGDAVAAQSLYNLKTFTDWLTANSQTGKGIITEIGIPGSANPGTDPIPGSGTGATYDPAWEATLQQVYEGMNRSNLHVTAWNASEWRVDLRAYETLHGDTGPLTYRTTVSSVLENNSGMAPTFVGSTTLVVSSQTRTKRYPQPFSYLRAECRILLS